jgi:hypothetical protein
MRLYWAVPYIGACSLQNFFSFCVQGALRYRYIGKVDDNGYGNGIGYADVTVTETLVQR